jgi:hypothetical protein
MVGNPVIADIHFQLKYVFAAINAGCAAVRVNSTPVPGRGRRGPAAPLRLPLAGGLFAVLVWSAHLLALAVTAGVHWPAELWGGTIVSTSGVAALLGALASRPMSEADLSRT